MTSPWLDSAAPKTQLELREFGAGDRERAIRDDVEWLVKNGYRAVAMCLLDELIREHKLDSFSGVAA